MITPHCPRICRYRYLCNEDRQRRTAHMFTTGEIREPKQCLIYPGFARWLYVEYGIKVEDKTAMEIRDEVVEAMRSRRNT